MAMELEKRSKQVKICPILLCKVCGDIARGFNFDVITCLSCKAFFRRNAFRFQAIRRCQRRNCCSIKKENRSFCAACRLKKCYALGMNSNLIRTTTDHTIRNNIYQRYFQLPNPKPLNLLQDDSSSLTQDQWNLLSNVIRAYDEQNIISEARRFLDEKSSLPVKLRLKTADFKEFMNKPLENMVPLLAHSPHFRCLPSNTQRAIILHNLFFTGCINGHFIGREINQFQNMAYMVASGTFFGFEYMKKCAKDNERLELNGNLVKAMLFVMIFSSNCSMIVFNDQEDLETMTHSIELIHIQDIYVTMLWKYLTYLYGYNEAAVRFSSLVKSILDMFSRVEALSKNIALCKAIDHIIAYTEQSLNINERMT